MYDFEHFDPKKIVSCHSDKVFNLAFPNENPNVLLSTSVDGTVRQHDIRERCKGQCQNVMLDFQRAKRNSLADGPTGRFTLCSSDLSPSSNLIVVGGDDRFGRLFDRRFVPKDSPVIRYYCPKHLSSQFNVQKFYGMDPIRVSKVAFSPNEWEVLISYTKEHIYVMNINHAGANEDLYSPDDVVQMFKVDVNRPRIFHESERDIKMRDQVRELLKGCNTHDSIDLLDAFLSLPGRPIDHGVIYEWLCCRAKFLLERNWKNDAHMAIRDCDKARKIKNNDYKAFYYLSKALLRLGRVKEAFEPAQVAKSLAPLDQEDVKKLMKKVTRRRAGRTARNEDSRKWTDGWDRNWPNDFKATDMKQRFIGHVNIHEKRCDAGFLGPTGDYIVSASGDNRLYIWEKRSGRLVRTLKDSRPIGQLLQCHPLDFAVATASSDIVQIWAQGANGVQTDADDDLIAMDLNQWRLSWS